MAPPLIEIDRLWKSFDHGRTFAVQDVSLTVEAGSFLAMVGASGSGKTTTLKAINRLIEPERGEIRIEGAGIASQDAAGLRRRIGYVFQGIGLFPHMSIAENIGITPQLLGWPRAKIASRAREVLELVGLPLGYSSRFPDMLSGGERQRVALARAIAADPRIVLMDEPFGALDPITRDTIGSAYRTLHDALGLTTIMVTHDVLEAVLLADRIAVMQGGRVLADGTPRMLMSKQADPAVAALLGMPQRQAERVRAALGEDGSGRHNG